MPLLKNRDITLNLTVFFDSSRPEELQNLVLLSLGGGDSGISGVVSSCGDSDNGMTGVSNSPFLIFYFLSRIVEFGNSWGLAVLGIMRQI